MIRVLLTELLKTTFLLVVVSVVAFAALDATAQIDWWGTSDLAVRAGISRDKALARDLPLLWNRHVADAQARTHDDLLALRSPSTRPDARATEVFVVTKIAFAFSRRSNTSPRRR